MTGMTDSVTTNDGVTTGAVPGSPEHDGDGAASGVGPGVAAPEADARADADDAGWVWDERVPEAGVPDFTRLRAMNVNHLITGGPIPRSSLRGANDAFRKAGNGFSLCTIPGDADSAGLRWDPEEADAPVRDGLRAVDGVGLKTTLDSVVRTLMENNLALDGEALLVEDGGAPLCVVRLDHNAVASGVVDGPHRMFRYRDDASQTGDGTTYGRSDDGSWARVSGPDDELSDRLYDGLAEAGLSAEIAGALRGCPVYEPGETDDANMLALEQAAMDAEKTDAERGVREDREAFDAEQPVAWPIGPSPEQRSGADPLDAMDGVRDAGYGYGASPNTVEARTVLPSGTDDAADRGLVTDMGEPSTGMEEAIRAEVRDVKARLDAMDPIAETGRYMHESGRMAALLDMLARLPHGAGRRA